MLPKGILFYGDPGEGKTHIVREYSKSFNYPIFVIEGNDDNVLDEVVKAYENASKEKNAIVVIDEIDKAYNLSFRLVNRTCIDGIKNYCTRDGYLDKKSNSEYLNRIFDHKASVYMRKNYKLVKKQLSQHKDLILKVADILIEKKELKRKDFLTIVEDK